MRTTQISKPRFSITLQESRLGGTFILVHLV